MLLVAFHFCFNLWLSHFCIPFVFLSPLSQLFVLLAVSSFCFCQSGGCLFSNTSQPAYLLGLYCCGLVFPTPLLYAINPLDNTTPSVMDIRVCVTVIRTVACNCYLEIMIVYDGQCPYGWLWEACMCWIRACYSACMSDCVMALCMTISND